MTLSVRRSVAALAVGAALVLAGCGGPAGPDRAAVVDGQVISETSLQAAMSEVNAMDPALLQAKLTPTGTLTALVQAPVVLTYLDGLGVRVSDSVAKQDAQKRGIADPADSTLAIIKLASGHLHGADRRQADRRRRRDADQAAAGARHHRQPALRHVQPADRLDRAHDARLGQARHRRAVTGGGLGLVVTSPRVAPGLLSHGAWEAVSGAALRLARSLDEPLAEAVEESGFAVEEVGDASPPELARRLVDLAATLPVVWLGSSDGDPGLSDALASEVSRLEVPPDVEVVVGSWDVQGGRLLDVVATMDRLRSPGGCPWDAEQTHASLAPYLVEEAHEVVHAIEGGDRRHLAEELGDVLLQVVFHARVAEEAAEQAFDIDTVAGLLVEKLVRRHPHVFADGDASTPAEVEQAWERIKAQEKAADPDGGGGYAADLLHGIPTSLPGDLAAEKVLARVRRRDLTPAPDAVAHLEQARAGLAAAEAEVRAALAALAGSVEPERGTESPRAT